MFSLMLTYVETGGLTNLSIYKNQEDYNLYRLNMTENGAHYTVYVKCNSYKKLLSECNLFIEHFALAITKYYPNSISSPHEIPVSNADIRCDHNDDRPNYFKKEDKTCIAYYGYKCDHLSDEEINSINEPTYDPGYEVNGIPYTSRPQVIKVSTNEVVNNTAGGSCIYDKDNKSSKRVRDVYKCNHKR